LSAAARRISEAASSTGPPSPASLSQQLPHELAVGLQRFAVLRGRVDLSPDALAQLFAAFLGDLHIARHRDLAHLLPGKALDGAHRTPLLGRHDEQRHAGPPSATGPTDAVHVGLRVHRNVEVDDVRDAVHVQTTCRDVRRHDDLGLSALERLDDLLALGLTDIAM
jgi:hypothetical protein